LSEVVCVSVCVIARRHRHTEVGNTMGQTKEEEREVKRQSKVVWSVKQRMTHRIAAERHSEECRTRATLKTEKNSERTVKR
jgi:hypothetical protein